ncbi:hypothetical protein RIF29_16428 [Crotalaria pallida]|uniref:Uncharacterized protein n=1 Tax=Crotalaria pallida TaxID=3830 RepID=A0AAN9FGI1_CROPI
MLQELADMKESLKADKRSLVEITNNCDRLRSLCEEKDKGTSEKRNMEARMANLTNLVVENTAKKDLVGTNKQVLQKLEEELKLCKDKLVAAEETIKSLTNEKLMLEQKLSGLEKKNTEEINSTQRKHEQEHQILKSQVHNLERKLVVFRQELFAAESTLSVKDTELAALKNNLRELEELREMKEDIDRKNEQTTYILKMQGAQLAEFEMLYKEEQLLYFKLNVRRQVRGARRVNHHRRMYNHHHRRMTMRKTVFYLFGPAMPLLLQEWLHYCKRGALSVIFSFCRSGSTTAKGALALDKKKMAEKYKVEKLSKEEGIGQVFFCPRCEIYTGTLRCSTEEED